MAPQESQSDSIDPPGPQSWKAAHAKRSLLIGAGLLLAAPLALLCDLPISSWLKGSPLDSTIEKLLSISESFSHGLGVIMLLVTVAVLDRRSRCFLPRLAAMSLGAGLLANIIKLLITRVRPREFDWQGSVLDTFQGFFRFAEGGSNFQSFPSAHTATAAGLAVALAWLYPQGRWWFAVLAILSGCQRMEAMAHFSSDVICGAALGCLWAGICLGSGGIGQAFDRVEASLAILGEDF